jgi:hypothetical protein
MGLRLPMGIRIPLDIPPHPDGARPPLTTPVGARRAHARDEYACGSHAWAALDADGFCRVRLDTLLYEFSYNPLLMGNLYQIIIIVLMNHNEKILDSSLSNYDSSDY